MQPWVPELRGPGKPRQTQGQQAHLASETASLTILLFRLGPAPRSPLPLHIAG